MSYPTNKNSFSQYLTLSLLLALFWLLMSGHYTVLISSLGLISIVLIVWNVIRMDLVDEETHLGHLKISRLLIYYFWLFKEILLSNITVAKQILLPDLPIKPGLIKVKTTQKTLIGKVVYANSITLTPGTVSLDIDEDYILIHALNLDDTESLKNGEMADEVNKVEKE